MAPEGAITAAQGQRAGEAPPRFSGAPWAVVWVVVGAAAGTVATWALLASDLGAAAAWLNSVLDLVLAALAGFGVAVVLAVPLAWWWLVRFVSAARGTLKQVVSDAAAVTRAAADNDAAAAVSHAERALHEAAAWYGPIAARRFVVQTALALLVTFGGLVGTGLLFRQTLLLGKQNEKLDEQTALLRDQNTKLDLQTVTAEAQRRAGLAAELFSILQTVSQMTPPDVGEHGNEPPRLPPGLIARIVAFSRAATPYWVAEIAKRAADGEVPVLRFADRPRSPERGHLLAGLVAAGIDFAVFAGTGTTFADADLREAVLQGADLRRVDLSRADLRYADLSGADLRGADLRDAIIQLADLRGADLRGAILLVADLFYSNLHSADLRGANLASADLRGAQLDNADLRGTYLDQADLSDAFVGTGSNLLPGQRPNGFPRGWSAPPTGWEAFEEKGLIILRRVADPPASPSSPSQ